jgi:predicted PurR-regulated permease PerM
MEELRRRGRTLYAGLVVLVSLLCLWLLWQLRDVLALVGGILGSVLTPVVISVIVAYLLNPLVAKLEQRGAPRGVAILIIYFAFAVALTALLLNMIPMFIEQLRELGEHVPDLVKQAEQLMDGINENKKRFLPEALRKALDTNLSTLEMRVTALISRTLESIGHAVEEMASWIVIPFLVFYMLKDAKAIERSILVFFAKENRAEITRMLRSIDEALGNYIRGQLMVSFLVGVLIYLGLLLVKMPYALLLALTVGVTNIIPYIGPLIGMAPAVLLALTVSPMMALKVAVVNLAVQQLEGNLISPLLIGRSLKLHPMLIIVVLLIGGEAFGLIGLILAIPVVAVGKVILQHLVLHYMKR